MKKTVMGIMVVAALAALALPATADYYATKADERAGRLTPGPAPAARPGPGLLAGTDACPGTTIPAGATTYTDSGTTIGATNTVQSLQAGCSDYTTVAGPDVIYTFALGPLASRVATLAITVTPTGATGYDPSIYTLSTAGTGCPAGTTNAVTNCVNGADSGLGNAAETITDAETDAMAEGTYFLFVDSFYSTPTGGGVPRQNGPYDLSMNRPLPVELTGFDVQ